MKKLTLVAAVIFTIALSAFTKAKIASAPKAASLVEKATLQQADFIKQSPMSPKANLGQADIN